MPVTSCPVNDLQFAVLPRQGVSILTSIINYCVSSGGTGRVAVSSLLKVCSGGRLPTRTDGDPLLEILRIATWTVLRCSQILFGEPSQYDFIYNDHESTKCTKIHPGTNPPSALQPYRATPSRSTCQLGLNWPVSDNRLTRLRLHPSFRFPFPHCACSVGLHRLSLT